VFFGQFPDLAESFGIVPYRPDEFHRGQPKLGRVLGGFDVDVGRFLTFSAEEVEPMWADFQDGRHDVPFSTSNGQASVTCGIHAAIILLMDQKGGGTRSYGLLTGRPTVGISRLRSEAEQIGYMPLLARPKLLALYFSPSFV